jgi:hypothetical protein
MTRVIIVGDVYYADLYPGGGPMPGGGGGPVDPGYGQGHPRPPHVGGGPVQPPHYPSGQPVPPGGPVDPGYGRPGGGGGNYPSTGPIYGGGHPGGGPMPGGERPDNTLPEVLPQGGTEIPGDVYQPAPIPEEIASQYVVSVYNPKTTEWTTMSYPPR